ncbi:protein STRICTOSIDINE SYNTHASE-LIKE 10-like [Neltuma alba]|uniref:protein STRICTOSIDINE SYNTHASE-LIKE 10-like n=1 Tax=Neltuma alba TaxID=207710 RepID=UPI0010A4A21D|nr:protein STRICTOSIDINE SYNTHASE-LIKE 10-like [Prosopis alba]
MEPSSSSSFSSVFFFLLLVSRAATFTFASGEVIFKDGLKNSIEVRLPSASGPESFAFDCIGEGPYTGISDGRILKWQGTQKGWVEFAVTSPNRDRKLCDGSTDPNREATCGRPLGLKFDRKTCNLYIADAYFGLLMVGPSGGVAKQLAISAYDGDAPFKFLNGLDVDSLTGVVYFSESSTVYQRREVEMIFQKGDKTGRLLKYDPKTKKVEILLKGLAFANGVALNKDGSFLLVAETSSRKITKFWLKGSKNYTSELFTQLERPPDNIKRKKNGDFWVGLNSNRTSSENANTNESLGDDPVGVKFDEKAKTLEVLDGRGGPELESVSEVKEHYGKLWIGSATKPYAVVVKV